jgi:CubicO group peptidase (beta-lactamase class C family)
MRAVDEVVDDVVAADGPGVAVGVVVGDSAVRYCRGLADLEWGIPVTPDTVFRLASLTKPFTSMLVLLLAADGLLGLDDPVERHLPGLSRHGSRITVRHLLNHTGGLPNFLLQPDFLAGQRRLDRTGAELVATVDALPLEFEPGERYSYTNTGYRMLDMLIESVTGTAYERVLARQVLAPLGMARTYYASDDLLIPRRARGYQSVTGTPRPAEYISGAIPGGAGGLASTVDDLLRWHAGLRRGIPLSRALLALAWEPTTLTGGRQEGYGLGWATCSYRGHTVVHHAGGIEGFSCCYANVPAADLGVVVLGNEETMDCSGLAARVIAAVLDLPAPAHRVVATPAANADRAGCYRGAFGEHELVATATGLASDSHHFVPSGERAYASVEEPDVTLTFHDDVGEPGTLTVTSPLFSYAMFRHGAKQVAAKQVARSATVGAWTNGSPGPRAMTRSGC